MSSGQRIAMEGRQLTNDTTARTLLLRTTLLLEHYYYYDERHYCSNTTTNDTTARTLLLLRTTLLLEHYYYYYERYYCSNTTTTTTTNDTTARTLLLLRTTLLLEHYSYERHYCSYMRYACTFFYAELCQERKLRGESVAQSQSSRTPSSARLSVVTTWMSAGYVLGFNCRFSGVRLCADSTNVLWMRL